MKVEFAGWREEDGNWTVTGKEVIKAKSDAVRLEEIRAKWAEVRRDVNTEGAREMDELLKR